MRLNPDLCQSTFVLWRAEGDSIEAQCTLAPHSQGQHAATIRGEHGLGDLTVEADGYLVWGGKR